MWWSDVRLPTRYRSGRRASTLDEAGGGFYDRPSRRTLPPRPFLRGYDDVLNKIFAWWNGATIGTLFTIAKRGRPVGEDEFGNKYYESKDNISYDGRKRRWVVYNGYADASKVSPDWYGWLHYTFAEPPTIAPLPRRAWEKPHLPNLTGTPMAWRPPGSLAADAKRPAATGDYEAWTPE
jgi:NADH:ubiquinone oxidoreductase subunit